MTLHDASLVLLWTVGAVGVTGWAAYILSVWLDEEADADALPREWAPAPVVTVPAVTGPLPRICRAEHERRRDGDPGEALPPCRIPPDIAAFMARRERGEL